MQGNSPKDTDEIQHCDYLFGDREGLSMKKIICMLLAAALLAGMSCLAEAAGLEAAEIRPGNGITIDLDGDGTDETLTWRTEAIDEYDEQVIVEAATSGGKTIVWESGRLAEARVFASDLDGDGTIELFVSGDEMSSDYITFCLNLTGGKFRSLFFADTAGGECGNAYYKAGYGGIVSISGPTVTLRGAQDILGTYMADRTLKLTDGCFELCDGTEWRIEFDVDDPEVWEYCALTLRQETAVTFLTENGEEEGTLKASERVIITGGDKSSFVRFVTEDGRNGFFSITFNYIDGWGSLINGVPEGEVFEMLHYAG